MKNSKYLITVLFLVLLSGCKEKQTYSYLMRHPMVLKQEITECQASMEKTQDQATKCETVMYAGMNMSNLISQQQQDPEKFGQRILSAQENYIKLKQASIAASRILEDFKNKSAAPADIRTAQDDVYKAKKACSDQLQEIKVLLAVVGLGSPV